MQNSEKNMSNFERIMFPVLEIIFTVICFPMMIYDWSATKIKTWYFLRGNTNSAWERCAAFWEHYHRVDGRYVGAYLSTSFAHQLTNHFIRFHPESEQFLVQQLSNPSATIAAYAFLCLSRIENFGIQDIPTKILNRSETITWFSYGCVGEDLQLGDFIRQYFSDKS
jgi:hypothetical protein